MKKICLSAFLVLVIMFLAGCTNIAGEAGRANTQNLGFASAGNQVTERVMCKFIDESNTPMTTTASCVSDMGHACTGAGQCAVSVTEKKDLTLIWKSEECSPLDPNGNVVTVCACRQPYTGKKYQCKRFYHKKNQK